MLRDGNVSIDDIFVFLNSGLPERIRRTLTVEAG